MELRPQLLDSKIVIALHLPPFVSFVPIWLVVEPYPSEKYDFVSGDDDIPNIWKVMKFHGSTPPTSHKDG